MNDKLWQLNDPLKFGKVFWPWANFYNKQREIIYAMRDSDEVMVPAGNMLGKDFVAGFICTSFFLRPQMYFPVQYVKEVEARKSKYDPYPHTCRIITTSVEGRQLEVLWGEIGRFVRTSSVPLSSKQGGPLSINNMMIRYSREREVDDTNCINYLRGRVAADKEAMSGHHAAYTLGVIDEASGVGQDIYDEISKWAKRILIIGNPHQCSNFFYNGVKKGDLLSKV